MVGKRAYAGTNRRHVSAEIDPDAVVSLAEDHPAVVEGRTLFPTTVEPSVMSPRFLVSGKNNPKLGAVVTKGPREGWPIYHLTLEERATCPRTCEQWRRCYGNAMHHARRHAVDDDFLFLLKAEIVTTARTHDAGFLVRLHTLGDFYSVAYVEAWGKLLAACPSLHVFGYTARRLDDPDPESAAIAAALVKVEETHGWGRFAIRTSSSTECGRPRATVVDREPGPGELGCPEQTDHVLGATPGRKSTESCATCGLCWVESARDRTIAFVAHGMKRSRRKAAPPADEPPKGLVAQAIEEWRAGTQATIDTIVREAAARVLAAEPAAAHYEATVDKALAGEPEGLAQLVPAAEAYLAESKAIAMDLARAEPKLEGQELDLLTVMQTQADEKGNLRAKGRALSDAAGLPAGRWARILNRLIRARWVVVVEGGESYERSLFKVRMDRP